METEQAVRIVEIAQAKFDQLFEEVKAELLGGEGAIGTDPTGQPGGAGGLDPWSLDAAAPDGDWKSLGDLDGVTYKWPDGNVDEYARFSRYEGRGEFEGLKLALGYLEGGDKDGDVVGFVLGAGGGSKRGITYFFPADDFGQSGEKISMIRGGGPNGRSGFGPTDPPPPAYAGFETAILRDRKEGKWRVLGVVVDQDDTATMLRHTALQARLRKLA